LAHVEELRRKEQNVRRRLDDQVEFHHCPVSEGGWHGSPSEIRADGKVPPVFRLLWCPACQIVFDRDGMAAQNMTICVDGFSCWRRPPFGLHSAPLFFFFLFFSPPYN
jgi:hypothetical protein